MPQLSPHYGIPTHSTLLGNSMQHLINILEWGAIRIFADLLYEAIRRLINIGLILCGGLGKQAKKNAITRDVSKFDSSQIVK